jgi:hypothetical protein
VIVLANGATLILLGIILYFKLRYPQQGSERIPDAGITWRGRS